MNEPMDWAEKRIVIFGCGYLGSRVARQALERGMEVTALTRNPRQGEELARLGVQRVVTAELDSAEWHPRIDPRKQDLVLNCVSSAGGGWEGYRKSYLEGMNSLLRWASTGWMEILVFTSSTSVYGRDSEAWVTEEDPAGGASGGGAILRQAEALLESGNPGVGRSFVLRLGGIYGPGRHHLLDRARASALAAEGGNDPAAGDVYLNSIHVDDAVAAVWAALGADPSVREGVFNIVDDAPASKKEIAEYLRRQVKERGLPAAAAAAARTARRSGVRPNRRISNRKARQVLGWAPRYPNFRSGYEPLLDVLE